MSESGWSELLKKEDWWAVWLGAILVAFSFAVVLPYLPDDVNAKPSIPASKWIIKPASWETQPLHAFFQPASTENDGYNHLPGLAVTGVGIACLFSLAVFFMTSSPGGFLRGFPLIYLLGIGAYLIAGQSSVKALGLSYVLWALVLGLLISNTVRTPQWLLPAVKTELLIKTGLVLLGAEILFGKILLLGVPGLVVAWCVTPIVILFIFALGCKYFKLAPSLAMVIAAATSVCGVSAAIATAGACKAKKEELTLAIGLSLLFTVIMMVVMPALVKAAGIHPIVGGAWIGGTVDATGAVVASGAMLGPDAEKTAAVVKMIQNILIGLVAFGVAVYWVTAIEKNESDTRPSLMQVWVRFPKFILGFIGASILFSIIYQALGAKAGAQTVDQGVLQLTKSFRGWFFCLAFVCIGLESNFRDLYKQMAGGNPLWTYLIGQSFNLVLTFIAAYWMFSGIESL